MHDDQIILNDSSPRLYERGLLVAHSSDDEGSPDVGISVGLGAGQMLYAGERPGKPGWSICIYPASGDATDIAVDVDAGEAVLMIEAVAGAICRST